MAKTKTKPPPTDERRFIGLRPPVPVSPTVYDGIRKVNPTYKDPKVNLHQQRGPGIEEMLASEANRLLVDRYGDPRENKKGNPLFSPHESGSDNALGHAGTAMVLANKVGWPLANIAGLGHELMVGLHPDGNLFSKDTAMDLRNNFMGSIAGMASTEKEQMDRLDYLYKNGWIQTLNPPSSIKLPRLKNMHKQPYRPPPKPRAPDSSTFKGTQVGEREYGPALNSVNLFKADQFLKKTKQKIPQFNNTTEMMAWLQKFVGHEKPEPGPDTNPFSTLKDNPLMPQLKAGINPYPGTRGYKSKDKKKPTLEDFIQRHPRK